MITFGLVFTTLIALEQAAQPPTPPPEPPPPAGTPSASEADFAAALAADQKATQEGTPAAAPPPASPPVSQALLNPETSVILTSSAGLGRKEEAPALFTAGDDAPVDAASVQEIEVTFAADVDPYFKARLFLAIPNLEGVEVEEGFLITTALPLNLQLKAGLFRSAFGRNNEQHLHVQDFARRPLTTARLGDDGLRPAGAQLSLLVPLPFYTVLWAEGFTLTTRKLSSAAGLDLFFELGPTWSLLVGGSGATLAAGPDPEEEPPPGMMAMDPPRRTLAGADLYIKWRPVNETATYAWVALTAEYIASRAHGDALPADETAWSGVGYAQLVAQVARRWRVGARLDVDGLPRAADGLPRGVLASASVAFLPTEFSRLRFTYQHQRASDTSDFTNDFFFLQFEGTIGAHGAHPF
jgi:hypothetical protein